MHLHVSATTRLRVLTVDRCASISQASAWCFMVSHTDQACLNIGIRIALSQQSHQQQKTVFQPGTCVCHSQGGSCNKNRACQATHVHGGAKHSRHEHALAYYSTMQSSPSHHLWRGSRRGRGCSGAKRLAVATPPYARGAGCCCCCCTGCWVYWGTGA